MDNINQEQALAPQTPPNAKAHPITLLALGISLVSLGVALGSLFIPTKEAPPAPEPAAVPASVEYITYKEHQLPLMEELAVSAWDPNGFQLDENGWLSYQADGVTALQGIDVSSHQGEIRWNEVAAAGMDFAMIRAGYRGYGQEGKLMADERFQDNVTGALAAGLDVGVYFFSQATNVWEAEEEVQQLLDALKGHNITYPVVFDWEYVLKDSARTNQVPGKTVSLMAQAFCGQVAQAGYTPGVYFNQNLGYLDLDLAELEDCVFWLAEYDSQPDFHYHADLWQYSSKGTVPGIDTPVDLNLAFRDLKAPRSESSPGPAQ